MNTQKDQTIVNLELIDKILFQENKIKQLNECLKVMKEDSQKIEIYQEKIGKEQKFLFRLGLGLLAFIILLISVMFISYSWFLNNGLVKNIYNSCNSIIVPVLLVTIIEFVILGISYTCTNPLNKNIKEIKTAILNISKSIMVEISKLTALKSNQLKIANYLKQNQQQEDLPKYQLESFLKELESSPKYEMYKILESLERQNLELPRKRMEEANETIK